MYPKYAKEITHEQSKSALQYLMFPKNENKGQIKGCGCANGKYQRKYTTKEDLSVPEVAIKFLHDNFSLFQE